jgi:hypothetical protein
MAAPRSYAPRFLNDAVRRKLEVTSAMAWEALVDAHVEQANQFIATLGEYESLEDALPRYLRELDLRETMAAAIRTRVLTTIEDHVENAGAPPRVTPRTQPLEEPDESWTNLLREPGRMVRGVLRRQKRSEEFERTILLALARAEENIIRTHVENAISFVALLENHATLDRAVQEYLQAVGLAGSRAQTVFQRTMAKLADVHLPLNG